MSKNSKFVLFLLCSIMIGSLLLTACGTAANTTAPIDTVAPATESPATEAPVTEVPAASGELILATTTSTRDSGLLDILLPKFEAATGIKVKMVAVGSGQALKMGEEGNADVLLVHSPASEKTYMDNGFGKDRFLVMHNDFIIVGPKTDLAKLKGSATAVDAFKKIADSKSIFLSRGDDSGTNKAELTIWKSADVKAEGEWYVSTGQGMGDTLKITSEKQGYTLTDRATFLSLASTLDLEIVVEGDKALLNIYHVITVNPEKWPKVNYTAAKVFADWLVSPEIQQMIAEFGKDKFGQALFFPDAGKSEDQLGK